MKTCYCQYGNSLDFICSIGATKLLDLGMMIILAKLPGRFGGTTMLQNMECVNIILSRLKDIL